MGGQGETSHSTSSKSLVNCRSKFNTMVTRKKIYTWQFIKHNRSLIPQHGCIILGTLLATAYSARSLLRNPDVVINKKVMEPWNELGPKQQYKFWSPNIDYKKLEYPEDRPNIYNK